MGRIEHNMWYLGLVLFATSALSQEQKGMSENHEPLSDSKWLLIDDFEAKDSVVSWGKADTKNETKPFVTHPQVTKRLTEKLKGNSNSYMLKKPAQEGVIGNRKALSFKALPQIVEVGETFTFYMRINVADFPNNHAFGISNMGPEDIKKHDYNAFEATLRVTDKRESNGLKNTGALMVKVPGGYANVKYNLASNERDAKPLEPGHWYQIWYVVNNAPKEQGGQTYDVYLQGGSEFPSQTLVYKNATFRMQREWPLTYFLMNCNTGPLDKPYGNGGLKYDDIYMVKGIELTNPS